MVKTDDFVLFFIIIIYTAATVIYTRKYVCVRERNRINEGERERKKIRE